MTTVFASGSRNISTLNCNVTKRLNNIINKNFGIIIGDANGADKVIQTYLNNQHYSNVVIFCSGNSCRNNVGNWNVENIFVDPKLKGRLFYTEKDKTMAKLADFGFVLWDGMSSGSLCNIFELIKNGRKALVYFVPADDFFEIKKGSDILKLLNRCNQDKLNNILQKLNLKPELENIQTGIW